MVEKDFRNSKYSESNKGCVWKVFEFQSPTENGERSQTWEIFGTMESAKDSLLDLIPDK